MAAIFLLLNDDRLSKGKAPLGFLNPWLYGHAQWLAFNNITSGTNTGCDTPRFSAIIGWDPVHTGRPFVSSVLTLLIASPIGHWPRVARLSKATKSASSW
jgi:tripeptidyl-peptidase-1